MKFTFPAPRARRAARIFNSAVVSPTISALALAFTLSAGAQTATKAPPQKQEDLTTFKWVNKLPEARTPLLRHGIFRSATNQTDVGWSAHLKSLGIIHEQHIAGDAPHSATRCDRNLGDAVMLFHVRNFGLTTNP